MAGVNIKHVSIVPLLTAVGGNSSEACDLELRMAVAES